MRYNTGMRRKIENVILALALAAVVLPFGVLYLKAWSSPETVNERALLRQSFDAHDRLYRFAKGWPLEDQKK
jgi:hypothetical protein